MAEGEEADSGAGLKKPGGRRRGLVKGRDEFLAGEGGELLGQWPQSL